MIDKKTEILKQDLKMLNVALECYMGKDLEEDSNLSRPVKQALKDFEELIDKYTKFNEDKSCTYMCDVKALLEEELSFCKEELELYKNLYNEALNHLEITLGQDKETIDKVLRQVVNGK